jgi:hypothetical protein
MDRDTIASVAGWIGIVAACAFFAWGIVTAVANRNPRSALVPILPWGIAPPMLFSLALGLATNYSLPWWSYIATFVGSSAACIKFLYTIERW